MIGTITALASTLVGPITSLVSEFIEDKDKAAQLSAKLSTLAAEQAHANAMAQIEVNKVEAASKSLFVAGWRPFVGWSCGVAMAFNYIASPILSGFGVELAILDITTMFPVLMGMLGFASLRSYEKVKGVSREK